MLEGFEIDASEDVSQLLEALDLLERERSAITLVRFTDDDAWLLGSAVRELAVRESLPISIQIRRGEQILFHSSLPGSSADSDGWLAAKARMVAQHGCTSIEVVIREQIALLRSRPLRPCADSAHRLHGGAIPIVVAGVGTVGSLAVSGLTPERDHDSATRAYSHWATRSEGMSPAADGSAIQR